MTTTTTTINESPSAKILGETPKRAFTFLMALGTKPMLRAIMDGHGYTQEDHVEGWRLLFEAGGSTAGGLVPANTVAASALHELDAWDEVGFHTAHAALGRKYPDQAAFLFQDLAPTQGPTAVLGIVKFLDRLDVLEKGEVRTATKVADKAAVELLAVRGIGPEVRAHLRELVTAAQSAPTASAESVSAQAQEAARMKALEALFAWYADWTEVARAVLLKRADRIQVGVGKRKKHELAPVAPPVPAPAPAPVPPIAPAPPAIAVAPVS